MPELEQNLLINRDRIEKIIEDLTQAVNKVIDCVTP
jgi:hypothetical protein